MKILSWGPLLLPKTNLISVGACLCAGRGAFSHAYVYASWALWASWRLWRGLYCPAEEPSMDLSGLGRNKASLAASSSRPSICCTKAFVSLKGKSIVRSLVRVLRVIEAKAGLPFCRRKLRVITMICCHLSLSRL